MKITVDNSEGCVQVVCHKIWDLNLKNYISIDTNDITNLHFSLVGV